MQRAFITLVAVALVLGSCTGQAPDGGINRSHRFENVTLRLTTGPQGGGFYPLGEQVARELRARMPTVRIETIDSGGAIFNIQAIQDGRADVGFTFADVAYMGFNGLLADQKAPHHRLRGIAVLQLIPISLVARGDLDIRNPRGLIGRRVSVGPAGSGTALTARLLLHEFGVDPPAVRLESRCVKEN
jgi:TRAP transporter TAXI family solute receptor